ncbi:MAG: HdeD family acid-resistance protein [Elainellaceae cyanobacterium]
MSSDLDRAIASASTWITVLGALMIVAGGAATVLPLFAPRAIATILAWIFLIAGVIRITQAFQAPEEQDFGLELATGILYLVAAVLIFAPVLSNVLTLPVLLAITLMLEGILEIFLALRFRAGTTRIWIIVSGISSLVLGILIGAGLTLGVVWLMGLLVGLSLAMTGIWFIVLARSLRSESRP